jgi:RimJ/RimL family protein N-acetyltransferase
MYARSGFEEPWIGYLVLSGATLVGTCAFASPPVEGRIEIAYFTFPPFEGRGLATAMASELVRIARQQGPALTIAAQTLVEPNASQRILEKLGFRDVASLHLESEGQVLEWQLPTSSG